jgi:hypothetical protein
LGRTRGDVRESLPEEVERFFFWDEIKNLFWRVKDVDVFCVHVRGHGFFEIVSFLFLKNGKLVLILDNHDFVHIYFAFEKMGEKIPEKPAVYSKITQISANFK